MILICLPQLLFSHYFHGLSFFFFHPLTLNLIVSLCVKQVSYEHYKGLLGFSPPSANFCLLMENSHLNKLLIIKDLVLIFCYLFSYIFSTGLFPVLLILLLFLILFYWTILIPSSFLFLYTSNSPLVVSMEITVNILNLHQYNLKL